VRLEEMLQQLCIPVWLSFNPWTLVGSVH